MRLTSLVRRSVALTAATALMSGGLASGFLASAAYAIPGAPVVTSFSPSTWDNRSSVPMEVHGSNFFNIDQTGVTNDVVYLTPVGTLSDPVNEVAEFYTTANPSNSTTTLTANIDLTMAPPGDYRLRVVDSNGQPSNTPTSVFTIYAFGSANATGVAFGPNDSASDNSSCPGSSCPSRGGRALDVTGSNIAVGAKARFLLPNGTPEPGMSFAQGNVNHSTNGLGEDTKGTAAADGKTGTGYASTTLLQGNYATAGDTTPGGVPTPGFTPGLHKLQIVNTDGRTAGTTVDFAQPWFKPAVAEVLSPASVTAGTSNVVVTLTGQGIRSGSSIAIESGAVTAVTFPPRSACAGVTTGASTVSNPDANGTFSAISVPVTVAGCSSLASRGVTIVGPDGATFGRGSFLPVLPAAASPHLTSIDDPYSVLGQGAHIGFAADIANNIVNIQGTNFAGLGETDPAKMVAFTFGPGVTTTTVAVFSGAAQVRIDVAPGAAIGERVATATNPSGAASTTAKPGISPSDPFPVAPLEIVAGPTVSKVSPPSLDPSSSKTITVTGTFKTSDSYSVRVCLHGTTLDCTDDPKTTEAGVATPNATTLTFQVSTNGADPGLRDLVVRDTKDNGRVYCAGCMGVDSLTLAAPTSVTNTGDAGLHFINAIGIDQVTNSSTATLRRLVPLTGQGPISLKANTVMTPGASGSNEATGTFALAGVAPGQYSITVVKDPASGTPTTWGCTGCLTVTGAAITTTALTREPGAKPASGGQGATGLLMKVVGTNFSKGMQVSIPDVTVHDLTLVSPTELSFKVDIASDAPTGAKKVTVTSGDGVGPDTGSKTTNLSFTVNPAPAPAGVPTPAAYGQGAGTAGYLAANPGSTVKISVSGNNFSDDATLSLGNGITVTCVPPPGKTSCVTQGSAGTPPLIPATPDTLEVTLAVAENAAVGKRDITVLNGDGGSGTLSQAFTVDAGPQVTSVANDKGAPVLAPDGVPHTVTVLGSGFASAPSSLLAVLPADGVTIANVTVVGGGKITAEVTVATTAVRGARSVGVTNPSDKGYGSLAPVYVGTLPGAPGSFKLVSQPRAITATWTAAAANGAPITAYHLTLKNLSTGASASKDVSGTTLSNTFSPLANGVSYQIGVGAVNAAGPGLIVKGSAVAGLATTLTNVASKTLVTYGTAVTFSGRLTGTSATGTVSPLVGRTISVLFQPAAGNAFNRSTTTTSTGAWHYAATLPYNTKVVASYAGDATYRPAAKTAALSIAARVLRTSPASGSHSSHTTTLKITGNVAPNKAGKVVYLYRYVSGKASFITKTTLTSTSTFALFTKPAAGTYTYRVYMPATNDSFGRQLNAAGYSAYFTLYRT